MLIHEGAGHLLGTMGGFEVANSRENDRPLHEDVPRPGKFLEMPIERCFGHGSPLDHLIGADRTNPTPAEQLVRRSKDPFPSRGHRITGGPGC